VDFDRDWICPYLCAENVVENEEKAQGTRRPRGMVHYPYTNRHAAPRFTIYRPLDESAYPDEAAGPLREIIAEVCELAAARRAHLSMYGDLSSVSAGKTNDTWMPLERDLREYLEKLPPATLYAVMVTATLGARPWRKFPDPRELYLQLSNRFTPANADAVMQQPLEKGFGRSSRKSAASRRRPLSASSAADTTTSRPRSTWDSPTAWGTLSPAVANAPGPPVVTPRLAGASRWPLTNRKNVSPWTESLGAGRCGYHGTLPSTPAESPRVARVGK
jgi:hypothetical protein